MKCKNIINIIGLLLIIILISSCHRNMDFLLLPDTYDEPIFPDYTQITVPVNIAPLNFIINDSADKYRIEFKGAAYGFSLKSKSNVIKIPPKKWRKLLTENAGKYYETTIMAKQHDGLWVRWDPIVNYITEDRIEPYISYRRINPGMIYWDKMDIVQRSLEDCREYSILSNQNTKNNCINCHTFQNRNPETLLLHLRKAPGGTLIQLNNKTLWLNTKTPHTLSSFVYPSWHPSEPIIAFSTNRIHQNFFGVGHRLNHVRDDASDIVIYDISKNLVYTDPKIATPDFENLPTWSPDGNYLYYIKTKHENKYYPDSLEWYDLMRIPVNTDQQSFGKPELLISSDSIQQSISWPQVSPDGKYLVFCITDYGYFTINDPESDLYMMELNGLTYKKLPVNSEYTESFPSWSGNSRWLMFTSKRLDGRFTIPCFSYIDDSGIAYKPFAIPMKNPREFLTRLTNINRPVFVSGKIETTQNELLGVVYSKTSGVMFDSLNVDIDAIAGATVELENVMTPQTGTPYMKD